jgi:hypothetical protein
VFSAADTVSGVSEFDYSRSWPIVETLLDPGASPRQVAGVLAIATPAELAEARRRLAEVRGDAEAALRAVDDQLDAMVTESPALKSVGRRRKTEL